jgi:hypothetical protein
MFAIVNLLIKNHLYGTIFESVVFASKAKQSSGFDVVKVTGLLRRGAPRNDAFKKLYRTE